MLGRNKRHNKVRACYQPFVINRQTPAERQKKSRVEGGRPRWNTTLNASGQMLQTRQLEPPPTTGCLGFGAEGLEIYTHRERERILFGDLGEPEKGRAPEKTKSFHLES